MKTKQPISAIFLIGAFLFSSCESIVDYSNCTEGKGEITEAVIPAENFSGLNLKSAYNIVITQGPVQEIRAVGHSNLIDDLELSVNSRILNCGLKNACYLNYELTLYVTVPTINYLKISGSGNISLEDFSNQHNLKTEITGSGDIVINLSDGTQNLDAVISGSGDIVAKKGFPGLHNVNIRISGSGSFRAYPLITEECSVTISGSGSSFNTVNSKLSAKITGSGSAYYKGRPLVDSDCSGSGRVVSKN